MSNRLPKKIRVLRWTYLKKRSLCQIGDKKSLKCIKIQVKIEQIAAKSSKKFHKWLLEHKRFGPILKNWETHKVVPKKAKILMVILQITAVAMIQYSLNNIFITIGLAVLLLCVAWYVISLPSKVPNES